MLTGCDTIARLNPAKPDFARDCRKFATLCRERERERERGVPTNIDFAEKIEQIDHTDQSGFPPKVASPHTPTKPATRLEESSFGVTFWTPKYGHNCRFTL